MKPLPVEIIEKIIDNVPDGQTFVACSLVCKEWLFRCRFYLFQRVSLRAGDASDVLPFLSGPTQYKAGAFTHSLIVTESSPDILSQYKSGWETVRTLIDAVPNVREIQMFGVTEWALERYLDGLILRDLRNRKNQDSDARNPVVLEDITLSDVRTRDWEAIQTRLRRCSDTLKCIRISSLHFYGSTDQLSKPAAMLHDLPTREDTDQSSDDEFTEFQDFIPPQASFENIERLALEGENSRSRFADSFLREIAPSPTASLPKLTVLDLFFPLPSHSRVLFHAACTTITELTIRCDTFSTPVDAEFISRTKMDFSSLKALTNLSIVGIRVYPSAVAYQVLEGLLSGLRSYMYTTLKVLHLSYKSDMGRSPHSIDQWNALDEVLSLPNLMTSLQILELNGILSSAGQILWYLPNARDRKIIRIIS
ncbi:hypothetical protein FRC17_003044 [Serendipita sp. 399]|nr:hypothetical protein FRC17_003044 [Serendipita sp. 399]